MPFVCEEIIIKGMPLSRGIAIGRPYFHHSLQQEFFAQEIDIDPLMLEEEIARYKKAMNFAMQEVKQLQLKMEQDAVSDGAAILEGHLQIMQDSLLTTRIEEKIRTKGKNAEFVFTSTIAECESKFNSLKSKFFKERFNDLQEISKRVLAHLREESTAAFYDVPKECVIFANSFSAFDTAASVNLSILAFVTREGGATSHAAIVARAQGIPFVCSVEIDNLPLSSAEWVIVDGCNGDIILNPTIETLKKYKDLQLQLQSHLEQLEKMTNLQTETYDGHKIALCINIDGGEETQGIHRLGVSGVGLFRTEFPFLLREDFPSEEEQYNLYRRQVEEMKGLPIVMRTFDVGGDKYLKSASRFQSKAALKKRSSPIEANPFLGCRAIRFLLKEKEIFKAQLRAILRAANFGNVKILFPMISSLTELQEAKAILQETAKELGVEGYDVPQNIAVGCMIEVPASAIIVDLLAKECDFLSIGTNDLVQYTLAVDRTNNALSHLYTAAHPSVIRLIRQIVNGASEQGIPVSVCGEVAADPRFVPLLIGLGVNELSVAGRYVPMIKNVIRSTSISAARKLVEQVLTLSSAEEIEDLLTREYRQNVPEDFFLS